jgi:toxin-antitoxin system PIN domain toxin
MISSCPDVNVWLALLTVDHVHHDAARRWWEQDTSRSILFCRLTQMGVLRLLTTDAVMNGKPLSMIGAWQVYDRVFSDERVAFAAEPPEMEGAFRKLTSGDGSSPKAWADAYLAAFADQLRAQIVTFDKALAGKATGALLLS